MSMSALIRHLSSTLLGLVACLGLAASNAMAATYNLEFNGSGVNITITGVLTTDDAPISSSVPNAYSIVDFSGIVTSDIYGNGAVTLVANPSPPTTVQDSVTGLNYNNVLYFPPDLPGAYFDTDGLLLTYGAREFSYRIFSELLATSALLDPMEVAIFDIPIEVIDGTTTITQTPLPAAFPLMGSVLGIGLVMTRWRRRRSERSRIAR